MDAPIPVTVVTGFLGAGKSTLVERWLRALSSERTALIVNEAGKVGIDGAMLEARATRLLEITGGCVCCQAQAELDAALASFAAATPRPTRIIVETSGAASPGGVVRALAWGAAHEQLRLDGIVTVLDATRYEAAMQFGLTLEQLGFADVVLLSHADRCTEEELRGAASRAQVHAPAAVFGTSDHGRVLDPDGASLLDLLAEREDVLRIPPEDTPRGHGIDAVSLTHDGPLDEDRFSDWVEAKLGAVQARILRLKGILAIEGVDQRVVVQGVGPSVEVSLGAAWGEAARTSRMVVLGLALDEAALADGFAACVSD